VESLSVFETQDEPKAVKIGHRTMVRRAGSHILHLLNLVFLQDFCTPINTLGQPPCVFGHQDLGPFQLQMAFPKIGTIDLARCG
jgi:hypothetical protein